MLQGVRSMEGLGTIVNLASLPKPRLFQDDVRLSIVQRPLAGRLNELDPLAHNLFETELLGYWNRPARTRLAARRRTSSTLRHAPYQV